MEVPNKPIPSYVLKGIVDTIITHLDISIAEFERLLDMPAKTLVMAMSENSTRLMPVKYNSVLNTFIDMKKLEYLFAAPKDPLDKKSKQVPSITEREFQDKCNWHVDVCEAIIKAKEVSSDSLPVNISTP